MRMHNVFQSGSEDEKRKVVLDMEEHLNNVRKEVDQLKRNVDPAADEKYNVFLSLM